MKKILTIQDISCYGQCSITVALPIISSYGIETAILPSSVLSTHTGGFKDFEVIDLTNYMINIVNHWKKENILFDAVYTGYIANAKQFDCIYETFNLLKDNGLKIVDPAFADHGRIYTGLSLEIVEEMKNLVSKADYILPNVSETCYLLDMEYKDNYTLDDFYNMAKLLQERGSKTVIITGISLPNNEIGVLICNESFKVIRRNKVLKSYHGTGDIFSSVFVSNILNNKSVYDSVGNAMDFVLQAIINTIDDKDHNYGVYFESVLKDGLNHEKKY